MKRILMILSLAVICLSSCSSDGQIEATNQANANKVIGALYKYKQSHNSFPNDLKVLVPNYISEIPVTTGGQEFIYKTNASDGFFLYFDVREHFGCGYTDRFKQWECSSGD